LRLLGRLNLSFIGWPTKKRISNLSTLADKSQSLNLHGGFSKTAEFGAAALFHTRKI
jgi:hypothetical protein